MDKHTLERLAKKRQIWLLGEINDTTIDDAKLRVIQFNLDSYDEIKLVFDSKGGDVEKALSLVNLIRTSKAPMTGVAIGSCFSAALMIYLACGKRVAYKHSRFFPHFTTTTLRFTSNPKYLKEIVEAGVKTGFEGVDRFEGTLVEVMGKSHEEVREFIERCHQVGYYLTPEQALELGFVHEIVESIDLF